jgi:hypothetical protein
MLAFVLVALQSLPPATTTTSAVAVDAKGAILDAFRQYPLVGIGDAHGDQPGEAFQLALIRDSRFAPAVNDIVMEFGNSKYQSVLNRFVSGEMIGRDELRRAWSDTTQQQVASLEVPELVTAVRALNATLPRNRRLRLWLGDYPRKGHCSGTDFTVRVLGTERRGCVAAVARADGEPV